MAVRAALHQAGVRDVAAIGLDGHMHGVVLLDAAPWPVGRAITWADQRSAALIPEIEARVGVGHVPGGERHASGSRLHGADAWPGWRATSPSAAGRRRGLPSCPRTTCACA